MISFSFKSVVNSDIKKFDASNERFFFKLLIFTIPLRSISQNSLISEILLGENFNFWKKNRKGFF